MAKRTPINNKQQTDGKNYDAPAPRTLADLMGESQESFSGYDVDAYKETLGSMNVIDLQRECVRIGLQPNANRLIMTERLVKQFNSHVALASSAHLTKQKKDTGKRGKELPVGLRRFMESAGGNPML